MDNEKNNSMNVNKNIVWLVGLVILILAFVAGYFAKGSKDVTPEINKDAKVVKNTPPSTVAPVKGSQANNIFDLLPPITIDDHIKGNPDANIVMIEYSDFQCPYCARFHTTSTAFLKANPDVAYVFRHLPLDFHQYALERARASECVVKLGGDNKFWEFSDIVYESTDLNSVDMSQVAVQMGINKDDFSTCVSSTEFDSKINKMSSEGIQFLSAISTSGGYGTPGVVIINREKKIAEKLAGAVPLTEVEAAYSRVK